MKILIRLASIAVILVAMFVPSPAQAIDPPDLLADQILTTTLYEGMDSTIIVLIANKGNTDPTAFSAPDFNVTLQANGVPVATHSVSNSPTFGWPAYVNFTWTPPDAGSYTLLATADSSGQIEEYDEDNNTLSLPFQVLQLAPVTVNVRVEGKTDTIWNGPVTFLTSTIDIEGDPYVLDHPTALGALDAAAQASPFEYVVTNTWGSPFVTSVGGEVPEGQDGWNYRVDWLSPSVGAADYSLGPTNAEVLWYFGSWSAKPLLLNASEESLYDTQKLNIYVEAFDDFTGFWYPVDGATVHAGGLSFLTNASGEVSFNLPVGVYDVFAEKGDYTQYTRSNVVKEVVKLAGDVDGDGHVQLIDLVSLAAAFGSHSGDGRYNLNADFNQDGAINILDLSVVGLRYGA